MIPIAVFFASIVLTGVICFYLSLRHNVTTVLGETYADGKLTEHGKSVMLIGCAVASLTLVNCITIALIGA